MSKTTSPRLVGILAGTLITLAACGTSAVATSKPDNAAKLDAAKPDYAAITSLYKQTHPGPADAGVRPASPVVQRGHVPECQQRIPRPC